MGYWLAAGIQTTAESMPNCAAELALPRIFDDSSTAPLTLATPEGSKNQRTPSPSQQLRPDCQAPKGLRERIGH
jgi:hypothetical protein